MGYRISIVVTIALLLALGAYQFGRNGSDEPEAGDETGSNDFYGELGIVGAITATAKAGGALDPTALVTPTSAPSPSAVAEAQPTDTPVEPTAVDLPPQLRVSSDELAPGESFILQVDGAEPGEMFDVSLDGGEPLATVNADENGSATIELSVPGDEEPGPANVTFSGAESPSASVPITIVVDAPEATVDPKEAAPGDSVRVEGKKFKPSEIVDVMIDGNLIGSAVAGSDGSLGITTQIPELSEGEYEVELEGSMGSEASTAISIRPEAALGPISGQDATAAITPVPSPADAAETPQPEQSGGDPVESPEAAQSPEATDSQEQSSSPPVGSSSPGGSTLNLDTWIYMVLSALAAWLAVLTLWIYRMDRRKDVSTEALANALAEAIEARERKTVGGESKADKPDRLDEVA